MHQGRKTKRRKKPVCRLARGGTDDDMNLKEPPVIGESPIGDNMSHKQIGDNMSLCQRHSWETRGRTRKKRKE